MTRDDIFRMAQDCWPSDRRMWCVDGDLPRLERFAALVVAAEREKVAAWMTQRSYATGHGDTTEDLLKELDWQIRESEREACAKVAESLWQQFQDTKNAHERNSLEPFMPGRFGFDQLTIQQSRHIATAIRARGDK